MRFTYAVDSHLENPQTTPMSRAIRFGAAAPVATLTLANPARHNALGRDEKDVLSDTLEQAAENADVRALILTGQGRSSCAGASLAEVGSEDWSDNPLAAFCDKLENFRTPIICAMNGGVYGGGIELALSCDFRIGVPGMAMFVPAGELGIHYPVPGLRRAVTRLGLQTAKRIFLPGDRFDTDAVEQAGFADAIVPADELLRAVREMTEMAAGLAPFAIQGMKATLNAMAAGTLDAATAQGWLDACRASGDCQEGLAARREKHRAEFKGA